MDDYVTNDSFKAHTDQDRKDFQVIHERMNSLATKDDIKELKEFMGRVNVGLGFFKFTWNNASQIGSFVLLIGAFFLFIKYGLLAVLGFFNPFK